MDAQIPNVSLTVWEHGHPSRLETIMTTKLNTKFSDQLPPLDMEGDNFRIPTGRGVLSAAEIEALLRPDIAEDAFEEPSQVSPRAIEAFEDSPEDKQTDLLDDAAALAARMTLSLRRACQVSAIVTVKDARQAPLSYLVSQYSGAPVLILFSDQSGAQVAGLTLDHHLVMTIIDRACGGGYRPNPSAIAHDLTALDEMILEDVLRPLARTLDPEFTIACIEFNRTAAHALLPPGKAMLAELSCQIDGVVGKAAYATLAQPPVLEDLESDKGAIVPALETTLTARIASLNVPVSRLSNLKAGSVLLLGLPTDQPVELLSGGHQGKVVAQGDVGRKGNRVAVRITKCKTLG